ncbi:uncharacterized protein LOC144632387 isoform X2 [Oculina patagonica]
MTTTMVGEETELKESTDDADSGHKEIKKAGLINAFFHPIKVKQHTKTSSGKETIPVNSIKESSQFIENNIGVNKTETGVVQDQNVSGQNNKIEGHTSKEKTSDLAGKSTSDHALSQEESVKPKQSKPKWSVTCAVRNPSKYLNSSGSDFEDEGKAVFKTKTKQVQKCGKKKAKSESRSHGQTGTQESERDVSESAGDRDRESKATHTEKSNTSQLTDKHNEHLTEKIKLDDETRALGKSENSKPTRTSAFDVLMKSQRTQKLEEQKTDTSLIETTSTCVMSSEDISENSVSCEIVDVKETLQSKSNVISQSTLSTSMADSSSDRNKTSSSSETNAFDFLMKKGRLGKSPSNMDSQPESEIDSEALENPEGSLKKKTKKKSFEFKLSICASKKKNVEFSLESDYASSDVVNSEEQSKSKSKKKTTKNKRARSALVEDASDESFVSEKCDEVAEVSKSKRGRKKSKVTSKEDQADISLLEVIPTGEGNKSDKKESKSGRKRVSGTKKVTAVANEDGDIEVIEPQCVETAQNKGRKAKQQRDDNENTEEVKDKKVRKPRKRMKSDTASLAPQSLSTEFQETSVCNFSSREDISKTKTKRDEKKQKGLPSETLSSTNDEKTACSKKTKVDNGKEMETRDLHDKETSSCNEPKALASIFLKRKPIPSKPETTEEPPTTAVHSVPSAATISSVVTLDTTNECSISDADSSRHKEKSAADQEAANKAFKALFTGASSQMSLPSSTAAEALPAPWPLVSHVFQKDEDVSVGVNFWCLPWPASKGHKSDDFSEVLPVDAGLLANVFANTSPSSEDRVMFSGRRHFEKFVCDPQKVETAQQNFPEAVTKKLLLELTLFYPGVPLRKLYKRYAAKLEKHKTSSVAVENKQSMPVDDTVSLKPFENNEEKHDVVGKKKGRGKRRLSSDGGVSQEKKVARKCEDLLPSLTSKGQDLSVDQSAYKSRKKRGREGDGDQSQEKTTKGRRLSTRLQKKKTTLESESIEDDLEPPEVMSNRKKKRRTSDHQKDAKETPKPCVELDKPSDAAVTSNTENSSVEGFVNDTLWTDLYRPLRSTEVMANASAVSKLRSWLEEWKIKREKTLRKELQQQKRLLAIQKGKSTASSSQGSGHTLEWWDDDSDSDFQMSDNASDDSDTEGGGLSTAMFISGPTGVGKTAMVYACAEELGYKVFEVNSSSKRSGKHILSQLEEATQSHLVINNKGPTPQSSFTGLFNKPANNSSPASGPLGAFLKSNTNPSETKGKKSEKGKKQRNVKEKKKDESKGKGKSILKQPRQAVSDGTESCSSLSSKAASLILFEEVDVIFEEDKSFWMAVNSFMQNAKCPIVLISTESQVSCEGRCDQINLKPPSVNLLAAHLQLVALTNNLFVNPEDLKSLVAQNNCDIRKSLLNLQFWSESGGGIKTLYERPASLKDKDVVDKHPKLQHLSVSCDSNSEHVKSNNIPSQDVLQIEPPVASGILNDDGEESMFLSLSDWQVIKNKGARRSSRTTSRGSFRQVEGDNNSDSDFCEPKKKTLVCNDGSTDSIFEITDTNDSQPVSGADKKADDSLQLPLMDSLLFESSHGLLNCVADHTIGSLSVLQKEKKPGDIVENSDLSDKLHLLHFSQGLDLNLIHTNLSKLIPLFADTSTSLLQTKLDPLLVEGSNTAPPITEPLKFKDNNIFSDKSLFDDGTEESVNKVDSDIVMETDQTVEKGLEDTKARAMHSSQDSTDTGFSESQPKEEIGEGGKDQGEGHKEGTKDSVEKERKVVRKKPSNEERCCSKALEIFAQFAENMSFSDAFCPSLSVSNTQSSSAEFGWWGASLKPGLTDDYVTVQECSDWLARETRASLRGALEVANLESCRVRINSLAEDLQKIEHSTQNENSCSTMESDLFNFKLLSEDLPPRDSSNVVRLDEHTQMQKSSTASRKKLYSSLGSCIPALYHSDHRCVACDYIPTLRLLCHSERLREAANIKRRFLHYLNFNSFPVSRSTMEALADSYLAL